MTVPVFAVSVTPFAASLEVDEGALRAHVRRLAARGLGIYVAGGGTGEGHSLSLDETADVLAATVDEVGAVVPVRAMGAGVRSVEQMIQLVECAKSAGVSAMQVYSPELAHGHRLREDDVHRFFDMVLGSTDLPCVLSTHRSVGYTVPVEVFMRLAGRHEHVIGFNVTHDLHYLDSFLTALKWTDRPLELYVGGEVGALDAMALGASGFLSSTANVAAELTATVGSLAANDRDGGELLDAHGRLIRLALAFRGSAGVPELKAVLNELGRPAGPPRPPHSPRPPGEIRHLVELVRAYETADSPNH